MAAKKRELTLTLEPKSGSFGHFYVFVDHNRVIAKRANKKRSWKGRVGDRTEIRIRVTGINDARFQVTIDLPGTAEDQKLTFALQGGYYECKLSV